MSGSEPDRKGGGPLEDQPDGSSEPLPRERVAENPGPDFVRWGLIFYGIMALLAVTWRMGFYGESILFSTDPPPVEGPSWLRDVAIGVVVAGAIIALSNWTTRNTAWGDRLARGLGGALGGISVPDALLLAMASGLAEEMFFRGALQPRVGWLLASLLFGGLHFVPRREFLPWTGFAILAGMLFGGLFIFTGNLVAPVVAHTLVNAVNLPILIRDYAQAGDAADVPEDRPG